jgi:transposase InsO family protein
VKVDPFIEAEKAAGGSVHRCCHLLEVSSSAYYERRSAKPTARQLSDHELTEQIKAIHKESRGTYGSPRVTAELRHRGMHCGRRRVCRLMALAGLEGRCKRRYKVTTVQDPAMDAAIDLIKRQFETSTTLDRRYVGDITYIQTLEGFSYLATVIDLASRRVVGWALSSSLKTDLVEAALRMAIRQRGPMRGVIFHSDKGCQYTSRDFALLARRNGVVLSVGRTGDCFDNAVAESFFATIKRELISTQVWRSRAALHAAVFEYIEGWFNSRRLHSSLGYVSPATWEAGCQAIALAA